MPIFTRNIERRAAANVDGWRAIWHESTILGHAMYQKVSASDNYLLCSLVLICLLAAATLIKNYVRVFHVGKLNWTTRLRATLNEPQ